MLLYKKRTGETRYAFFMSVVLKKSMNPDREYAIFYRSHYRSVK